MDQYMEHRLTKLHHVGVASKIKEKFIIFLLSTLIIIFLPYLHIGVFYRIWTPDKADVDRASCVNHCFDTVFRGRYEWPPSSYKHVYFNATSITMRIWIVVILGVISFYECLRHLIQIFWTGRLRRPMLVVFLSSLYPHYYGWWGMFNYLNEEYWPQYYHQIFFSLTEALSTAMVVHLCNMDSRIKPWKLLIILNINLMHIIIGCLDQFINNIIYHQGVGFEALRDLGLLAPDILHILIPFFELQTLAERRDVFICQLFYREELMLSALFLVFFSLIGYHL